MAKGKSSAVAAAEPHADVSRAEYVYRQIREGIRGGVYKPGQRIRELELAAALGTSRTPVREAIRRLESERLIEDVPGQGLAIVRLNEQRVRELYLFRAVLEAAAAELAASHASDFEVAALRDILAQMAACGDDRAKAARLNRRFHRAIYDAARNHFLAQAIEPMADFIALLPGTTYETPGRMDEALAEHRAILAAIERRAPEAASQAARAHIRAAAECRIRMMFEYSA